MYKIKLPKILFLALDIARFYRNIFFNTNDLAQLANRYKSDLVRMRIDKKDYKYLDDTRYGGLRGNFSTLLTWRGLVKRGSNIISTYSLGRDGRLVSAICKGKIILNSDDLSGYTNNKSLKKILEVEAWLLNVREAQAHVKIMLRKNQVINLARDSNNFPKESVFKSERSQYFIRSLVNNFVDQNNRILQFSILNLWQGIKFNKLNLHPLLVLPLGGNPWGQIYAIKNEDLYLNKPLLLNVDLKTRICQDENEKIYRLYTLQDAIKEFSKGNDNIKNRLDYKWVELKERYCDEEVDYQVRKEDEFSNFLRQFLNWRREFSVDGKDVVDVRVISSGGPDVELVFSGGTIQKLELEHSWSNYLDHGHHLNGAFKNVWIFAEERFDFKKILKIFGEAKKQNNDRIPDVFLCTDDAGQRQAFKISWQNMTLENISISPKDK